MCCELDTSISNPQTTRDGSKWHNSGCIPQKVTNGIEPHLPRMVTYCRRAFYYNQFIAYFRE